jgi:hypothetical protein
VSNAEILRRQAFALRRPALPQDDIPQDDIPQDDIPQDDIPQDDIPRSSSSGGLGGLASTAELRGEKTPQ